jgi:hypothetical protein
MVLYTTFPVQVFGWVDLHDGDLMLIQWLRYSPLMDPVILEHLIPLHLWTETDHISKILCFKSSRYIISKIIDVFFVRYHCQKGLALGNNHFGFW